jgi:hypothetical protein
MKESRHKAINVPHMRISRVEKNLVSFIPPSHLLIVALDFYFLHVKTRGYWVLGSVRS